MTDQERIAELEALVQELVEILNPWSQSLLLTKAHQYLEARKLGG